MLRLRTPEALLRMGRISMKNLKDLFLLDPEITFLNHGSFGATPKVVFDHYQALQLELERQPLELICQRAREQNILTIIDGAHAPGQIDLNLETLGADFYGANLHKWLCAPKGSGFLYASPEYHKILEPLVVSWGWESEKPGPSILVDYHEWQGTRDPAAFLAVPTAIKFLEGHDWDSVRKVCHEMVLDLQKQVSSLTGLEPISEPEFFHQMVSMPLHELDHESLQERLYSQFKIEVPVFLWKDTPYLRVCIQGYNSQKDIEVLMNSLRELL